MKKSMFFVVLVLLFLLASCSNTQTFQEPDIKDDFCGVHINFQYCKCAFHNEYCDAIRMDKATARNHVESEFEKWVNEKRSAWLNDCKNSGGIPGSDDCTYCDEGFRVEEGNCVPLDQATDDLQNIEKDTSEEFIPDKPLRKDCTLDTFEFDNTWRKYSDIDEAIPFNERSYEAKQALSFYDEMIEKMIEAFALERDIEIENKMQEELEAYHTALVQNIKTNLMKAFWRLSWVTYTTVKSGTGLGESYSQVLTTGASAESIGAGLKVIQGVIPGDSSLAINTSSLSGKAKSVGANVALEAVDSLGDPVKIATELFKSTATAPLPSADISQEEIGILKEQHLTKGVVEKTLQESKEINEARQLKLETLEKEIQDLQEQIKAWEDKEKERVKNSLEDSCLILKEEYEKRKKS